MKRINKAKMSLVAVVCLLGTTSLYAQGAPDYTTTSGIEYATQPVVHAVDANGNIDADYSGDIVISTATGEGVLGGTTTVAAQSGIANFTDLKYTDVTDKSTYRLEANATSLELSESYTIASDIIATKYIFTTQPAPTTIPKDIVVDFTTDPVVKAVDANDHVDTDNSDLISITAGSMGTALTNNQAQAVNGVATFTGLTINHHAYETLTLQAYGDGEGFRTSSDSLTVAYSAPTITSTPTTTSTSNSVYNYVLGATNVGAESLTWTVASGTVLPSWLSLGSGTINTFAGTGDSGYTGDDGEATSAQLNWPSGVAVDNNGNIYIADEDNHRIRKVDLNGVITTVAGNGVSDDVVVGFDNDMNPHYGPGEDGGFSGDGEAATSAQLAKPRGVAVDSFGNIYIADTGNNRIRKVDVNTSIITTVAGDNLGVFGGDDGAATSAQLSRPSGVAVDSNGNIYIADTTNSRIRKVDVNTGIITTVAGDGSRDFAGDGGDATSAHLSSPRGVAVDSSGIYIADSYNNRIRKIDITSGIITTVAGNGVVDGDSESGFSGDDIAATSTQLNNPRGVTIDSNGNIYIADTYNHRIRKVDVNTGMITTVAGDGSDSSGGDGGAATSAQLYEPYGIAVDSDGNIYIAAPNDKRIRKVDVNGAVLQGTPTCSDAGEHTIALTLSDGTTSLDHNFTLTITDDGTCNTAPTASAVSFTIDEDTSKTFTANDFNFTDVDVGDTLESIFITTLQSEGNLTLSGTAVTLNQEITTANISNLVFSPVANTYGTPYATFGFTVNDGEANSTSAYVATINVNEVVKDIDGDGINDDVDPNLNDGPLADYDNDSILNQDDPDDDNDGYDDGVDDFPFDKTEWLDTDSDGTGDNADSDDDNDGISDADEERLGFDPLDASDGGNTDTDGDGVSNADEIEAGSDPLDPNDTKKLKKFLPILIDGMTSVVPLP